MKKALIVYDTIYGNTEKIAMALMKGMKGKTLKVTAVKADGADVAKFGEYDLLAFGSPTHGFGISRPMKELLGKLVTERVQAKKAFAFDTKSNRRWTGSAGKRIEKRLRDLGMIIVKPYQSAAVAGTRGPLVEGAERAFEQVGREIAELLK